MLLKWTFLMLLSFLHQEFFSISINAKSNYLPTMTNELPNMINKHLSDASYKEE